MEYTWTMHAERKRVASLWCACMHVHMKYVVHSETKLDFNTLVKPFIAFCVWRFSLFVSAKHHFFLHCFCCIFLFYFNSTLLLMSMKHHFITVFFVSIQKKICFQQWNCSVQLVSLEKKWRSISIGLGTIFTFPSNDENLRILMWQK